MPSRINPAAFSNAFSQQLQLGAQLRASDQEEQQRALQIKRGEAINALGQNPNATPEQYVRAGDAATGNALAGVQEADRARQAQAFPRIGQLATQLSTIQDPAQKRAAFKSAILANGDLFDAMGMPHTDALAKLDQTDDATLNATLAKLASFAPPLPLEKVGAGESLVRANRDGTVTPTFTNDPKDTNEGTNYERARAQGYKGTFYEYQIGLKRAGANQVPLPSGYKWNPDGTMSPVTGGPADPKKPHPQTDGDKQKGVLFDSMLNAENDLAKLGADNPDTSSMGQALLGSNPITATMQSDKYRKYESGALRFAANLLYIKSGATAPPEEVRSTYKQLFPQPGDGPEVKAQKNAARIQELSSIAKNYGFDASRVPAMPGAGDGGGGPAAAAPPANQGAPVRVNSPAEAAKLPPGTVFLTPDGRTKVVPQRAP